MGDYYSFQLFHKIIVFSRGKKKMSGTEEQQQPPAKKVKKNKGKNPKKLVPKQALDCPFEITLLSVSDQVRDEIFRRINVALFRDTTHDDVDEKGKRKEILKFFVVGANAVMRALEKEPTTTSKIRCVVVCKNVEPTILPQHIAMTCSTSKIPVCVVNASSVELGRALGIPSAVAFGVKSKEEEAQQTTIEALVEEIIKNKTRVNIPWIDEVGDLKPAHVTTSGINPKRRESKLKKT